MIAPRLSHSHCRALSGAARAGRGATERASGARIRPKPAIRVGTLRSLPTEGPSSWSPTEPGTAAALGAVPPPGRSALGEGVREIEEGLRLDPFPSKNWLSNARRALRHHWVGCACRPSWESRPLRSTGEPAGLPPRCHRNQLTSSWVASRDVHRDDRRDEAGAPDHRAALREGLSRRMGVTGFRMALLDILAPRRRPAPRSFTWGAALYALTGRARCSDPLPGRGCPESEPQRPPPLLKTSVLFRPHPRRPPLPGDPGGP